MAGTLPPQNVQAVMSGNGLAGVLASLLRIITKLTITIDYQEQDKEKVIGVLTLSSSIFFFFSAGMMVICLIGFVIMMRTEYVQYYLRKVCFDTNSVCSGSSGGILILHAIHSQRPPCLAMQHR